MSLAGHCPWGRRESDMTKPKEQPPKKGSPGGSDELACDTGDAGSIPGSGRCPREGNGYPHQYSCLENPMDRGAWRATVHGVTGSDRTEVTEHTHTFPLAFFFFFFGFKSGL